MNGCSISYCLRLTVTLTKGRKGGPPPYQKQHFSLNGKTLDMFDIIVILLTCLRKSELVFHTGSVMYDKVFLL